MPQTERKVLFFEVNTVNGDIEEQPLKFEETCNHVMNLSPMHRRHKIAQAGPEEFLRLTSFSKRNDGNYEGVFTKYRSGNITAGTEDSDALEDKELENGIRPTEIAHFVYITKYRILCIEYNHSGPKHMQFINYINVMQIKCTDLDEPINYMPVVLHHPDVLEELKKGQYIKTLELVIPRQEIPTSSQVGDIIKALLAAAKIGRPGRVGILLYGPTKRGDKSPLMTPRDLVTKLQNDDINLGAFGVAKAEVMMEYGMDTINLLQNKIDSTIKLPSKVISESHEIFSAIITVFTLNKPILIRAVSAALDEDE